MSAAGLDSYSTIKNHGALSEASPHRVVQLMLESMLCRIAEARGHMERGEVQAKGEKIGKALAIAEGLMLNLDMNLGGDIAANLQRLYDYSARTLLRANLENRVDLLDEVASLIRELKAGWDGIPAQLAPER
jgi:flagellar protein FliS